MLVLLVVIWVLVVVIFMFCNGIIVVDLYVIGMYWWVGMFYVQLSVMYMMVDGKGIYVGGALIFWVYVGWFVMIVVVGCLWCILVVWWCCRRLEVVGVAVV